MTHTRPQRRDRELHVAQLQRRADVQGLLRGSPATTRRASRSSTSRRWATRTRRRARRRRSPTPIPRPFGTNFQPTAGDWSTHFYNGQDLPVRHPSRPDHLGPRPRSRCGACRTPDLSNPQTQTASFAQDVEGPAITIAAATRGRPVLQGSSQQIADFSCADADSGVESCVGTVADGGGGRHESKIGDHDVHGDRARQGRHRDDQVRAVRGEQHRDERSTPSATVAATLSLGMGTPATFGAFFAGRRARVHGEHDRQRDLDRRRRGPEASPIRAPPTPASWSTARSRCHAAMTASAASAGGSAAAGGPVGGSRGPDVAAQLRRRRSRTRRGDADVQAGDRRERGAADGHVQQDADVHAVDNGPVVSTWSRTRAAASGARPGVETTQRARSHLPLRFSISLAQGP